MAAAHTTHTTPAGVTIGLGQPIARVGETINIATAATPIPERCFQVGNWVAIPGPTGQLYTIHALNALRGGGTQVLLANLVTGGRKAFTREELEATRPIGFLVVDPSTPAQVPFIDGGIYQAWPSGRVFRVTGVWLVDAVTNLRLHSREDRAALPNMIPVMIPRWIPPDGREVHAALVAGEVPPPAEEAAAPAPVHPQGR